MFYGHAVVRLGRHHRPGTFVPAGRNVSQAGRSRPDFLMLLGVLSQEGRFRTKIRMPRYSGQIEP